MAELRDVGVPARPLSRLSRLIGAARVDELNRVADQTRSRLDGARIWNISSTSIGGGVAEMLRDIVGYSIGSGIDVRWTVIEGDQRFFGITKRLHNRLHGTLGDGGALGLSEAGHYKSVLQQNALILLNRIGDGDVVILHDPQTLGLAGPLAERGALVVWRCHIGTERTNGYTEEGWRFLEPFLAPCRAYVFSHRGFVPPVLEATEVHIIAPSIDPCSAKNRPVERGQGTQAPGRSRPLRRSRGTAPQPVQYSAARVRCSGTIASLCRSRVGIASRTCRVCSRASLQWWRGKRVCGSYSSDRR